MRLFGARVETGVHIHPSARIAVPWNLEIGANATIGDRVILYSLGTIKIGADATVSQGVHICAGTHDYSKTDFPLKKLPITVGCGAWICADAFLGPGIEVGDGTVVGARSVVMRSVGPRLIVAGHPAQVIGKRAAGHAAR